MVKSVQIILATVLAAVCSCAVQAQTIDPLVDFARYGTTNLKAIDAAGNIFTTYFPTNPVGTWRLIGNIPSMANRGATSPFVAICESYTPTRLAPDPTVHSVVTADGEFYAETFDGTWAFCADITSAAGRPATGPFVALASGNGISALTSAGERYRAGNDRTVWEFVDSIPAGIGAVPTTKSAMGSLKALFR
jgi:hypothetical protein